MKAETVEKLKAVMVEKFKKYGDDKALMTKGKLSFTGNQIANEIENETEQGIEILEGVLKLTIELLNREKIEMK